jgi:uncharacterized protein (TIGR02466 family)
MLARYRLPLNRSFAMRPEYPLSESISLAFSTPVLRRKFPEAAAINEGLKRAIFAKEQSEPGIGRSLVGGWHSRDDLLDWPDPEIRTLRSWIGAAVQEMTAFTRPDIGQGGPVNVDLGGGAWANIVRNGSHHKIHNHPDCDWSGVYYVAVGVPDANAPAENGMIEFLDPRMGATLPGLSGPEALPKLRVPPEPGLMLLFPSWLYHYVNTFQGTGERISIAFNVKLRFRPA